MQKAVDDNSNMYLRYRIDGKHSSKYLGTVDSTVYAEYISRRELKLEALHSIRQIKFRLEEINAGIYAIERVLRTRQRRMEKMTEKKKPN